MLTADEVENQERERFIVECVANKDRFVKTVKKNPNFGASSVKKKSITVANKVQQVWMQRDLVRIILILSL